MRIMTHRIIWWERLTVTRRRNTATDMRATVEVRIYRISANNHIYFLISFNTEGDLDGITLKVFSILSIVKRLVR